MIISLVLKLFHILAAIWMISGMAGRGVTFWQAARSQNVHSVGALLAASDFFERRMVIPGSGAVFLLGLATAWAQGWPILGFLQGSSVNWPLASILLYLTLLPAIPLYLIPRRAQRDRAIEAALGQGQITPELTAAVNDQGVMVFRTFELVIVLAITFLMVVKPI